MKIHKVEKILKGGLESIPKPKVCLKCKDKTLLGAVNKLLKAKNLLTSRNNVLPYYLK